MKKVTFIVKDLTGKRTNSQINMAFEHYLQWCKKSRLKTENEFSPNVWRICNSLFKGMKIKYQQLTP